MEDGKFPVKTCAVASLQMQAFVIKRLLSSLCRKLLWKMCDKESQGMLEIQKSGFDDFWIKSCVYANKNALRMFYCFLEIVLMVKLTIKHSN